MKAAVAEPRSKATNGAVHNNGSSVPAPAKPALADGVAEPRLDAGTIKTKSGVDLTEKVRRLLLLAKEQVHRRTTTSMARCRTAS